MRTDSLSLCIARWPAGISRPLQVSYRFSNSLVDATGPLCDHAQPILLEAQARLPMGMPRHQTGQNDQLGLGESQRSS